MENEFSTLFVPNKNKVAMVVTTYDKTNGMIMQSVSVDLESHDRKMLDLEHDAERMIRRKFDG